MDKDTFPKPDDFLGKAELTAADFYPNGFHGELLLADSKTQASLAVMVIVVGCDEAPYSVGGEGAIVEGTMQAGDGSTMAGNSSTVVYSGAGIPAGGTTSLPSGVISQRLPVYSPGVTTTTTETSQSVVYSAPSPTYSAPMTGMVTTSVVESQSMASQSITYAAAASQAPVPSETVAATGKVIVHPPVTVTAEEFAKIEGTLVTEPLPVTVGVETVGVETNRELGEASKLKIKKKKKSKNAAEHGCSTMGEQATVATVVFDVAKSTAVPSATDFSSL
eukprot:CAMPEP_0172727818 /NCGR_PEP_ID=MMETSP1074-20121228/91890_1 /TAXON_ID=2916 /ORGANISM="Ceratium fusus, Strain PA161109" /LENGTH=276 /DNA_ID=CAMNT_0013554999 /DNA_START=1 /DNA_END=829 /DNA_ORIENTATION=-